MTHTVIYFLTIVLGQLVSFVLLPVVTRYLDPAQFGEYALVLTATGFVGTFGSAWVRNVGMRIYFDHIQTQSTRRYFWTAATLQAALMIPALGIGYFGLHLTGNPISLRTYAWGGVSVLVGDLYALALNTVRAEGKAMRFGIAEAASALIRLTGTWVALVAGYRSPATLFLFASVAPAAAVLTLIPVLCETLQGVRGFDRAITGQLVRLGIPSIPLSIGGWTIALSDRLFLAYFTDVSTVGVYSAAYTLADRAVGGVVAALFMAAWPAALNAWVKGIEHSVRAILFYLRLYVLLLSGPTLLLSLESKFVLNLVAGPEYLPAASVIPWVAASAWISGFTSYLNRPIELQKKYGVMSGITMAGAAANVILNLIAIPRWGTVGAAASTTVAFFALLVMFRIYANREFLIPIPWKSIGIACLAAVFAAGAWWITRLQLGPLAAVFLYLVVYYGIILMIFAKSGGLRGVVRGGSD